MFTAVPESDVAKVPHIATASPQVKELIHDLNTSLESDQDFVELVDSRVAIYKRFCAEVHGILSKVFPDVSLLEFFEQQSWVPRTNPENIPEAFNKGELAQVFVDLFLGEKSEEEKIYSFLCAARELKDQPVDLNRLLPFLEEAKGFLDFQKETNPESLDAVRQKIFMVAQAVATDFVEHSSQLLASMVRLIPRAEDAAYLSQYCSEVSIDVVRKALSGDELALLKEIFAVSERTALEKFEDSLNTAFSRLSRTISKQHAEERQCSFGNVPEVKAGFTGKLEMNYETGFIGFQYQAYQDLQIRALNQGDYIRIIEINLESGPKLLFSGFIDQDKNVGWRAYEWKPEQGQQVAGGFRVLWVQAGVEPDVWAGFFDEDKSYKIEIWEREKSPA